MDEPNPRDSSKPKPKPTSDSAPNSNRFRNSHLVREREKEKGEEGENENPSAARKVLKADREKLRRDRLNEHFHELGNTLDPDRPKNDKATILSETIQMLRDLTAEVNRLKMEHKALSEESRELMQEKNELREEKTSLKSDIENLNAQYQQRVRIMYPSWSAMDHSVVISPPYSYPVPISIHPSLQPFPFFGNQNPGHIPNPCSMYVQYTTPTNPQVEHPSGLYASTSHASNQKEFRCKSAGHIRSSDAERGIESHDVATDLELKMPGSSSTQQDCTSGRRKGKHSTLIGGSASSQYSSSQGLQDSSNSVGDITKNDN